MDQADYCIRTVIDDTPDIILLLILLVWTKFFPSAANYM